jgi:hypothetical protein
MGGEDRPSRVSRHVSEHSLRIALGKDSPHAETLSCAVADRLAENEANAS